MAEGVSQTERELRERLDVERTLSLISRAFIVRGVDGMSSEKATAGSPRSTRSRRRYWLEVGWKYVFAAIIVFYAAFPLLYTVSAAFNPSGSLSGASGLFSSVALDNFADLAQTPFWNWISIFFALLARWRILL